MQLLVTRFPRSAELVCLAIACGLHLALPVQSLANDGVELPQDLTTVGLDRLLNFDLVVTTPSRKEQRFSDTASAVYVLTSEDIRRSGATHVAEALRLVPGVNVARVSSNRWAISIRGFDQMFANKLLVLVDGVSVFSPTTNGVYWEANEVLLEDVARIEVVRGPGGALWGANAVNGVINIVTKSSRDTQGGFASVGGGTHERTFSSVRYGGAIGPEASYRLFAGYRDRGDQRLASSDQSAQDSWQSRMTGFRIDTAPSAKDSVTLTGDYQYQTDKLFPTVPITTPPFLDSVSYAGDTAWRTGRVNAEWKHELGSGSALEGRVNFSRTQRISDLVSFKYDVANAEVEHRLQLGAHHDLVYGVGYRYFYNTTDDSPANVVSPERRGFQLGNLFVQDEISVVPDRIRLTLGSKFEYNELTALELMPSARLLFTVSPGVTAWAAVSRAVASPALFFEDSVIPVQAIPDVGGGLPGLVSLRGSRSLESESLLAYEAGVRTQMTRKASVDLALFFNQYDDLISVAPTAEAPELTFIDGKPVLDIPLGFGNSLAAHSLGGEVATELQLLDNWRVILSHTYLALHVDLGDSGATGDKALYEGGAPRNRTMLRSVLDLSRDLELDATLHSVGGLGYGNVSDYVELDVRVGWRLTPAVSLSLVGQNLLNPSHAEFVPNLYGLPPTRIERAVFGQMAVTF
jgi:iron complex outermembrane receptor protein